MDALPPLAHNRRCSQTQDVQFNAALVRSDKALLELAGILEATRSGWQSKACSIAPPLSRQKF